MPDPTADLLTALSTAQFALIEAAEAIRSREGYSRAYSRAANASHAARDAIVRYRMATDTTSLEPECQEFEQAAIRFWQQIKDRRSAAQSHD
jgi:hypothetical protein